MWFIAGFVGGCVAMYLVLIKLALDPHHRERPMPSTDTPKPKRRNRFTWMHGIGLVVLALTIFSAIQAQRQSDANKRQAKCLATYANAIADAIDARSKAALEVQKATVEMWRTIFGQPQTDAGRAESKRVFESWLRAQEASIQTQQTNPYPAPPREVCPTAGG